MTERDIHGAIELVATAARSQISGPFEPPVIERLLELISADRAAYFELALPGCTILRLVARPAAEEIPQVGWAADQHESGVWSDYPLADWRRLDETRPLRLSDFLSPRELHRTPFYAQVLRPMGIEHELRLWLPSGGNARGFALERGPGRDFNEHDRAVLALLRPHLAALLESWERKHRSASLTRRQAEVLALVAEGLTNREIARRLVVSSGTVRTHLENIFEKLGVHTRTAAVAVAFR